MAESKKQYRLLSKTDGHTITVKIVPKSESDSEEFSDLSSGNERSEDSSDLSSEKDERLVPGLDPDGIRKVLGDAFERSGISSAKYMLSSVWKNDHGGYTGRHYIRFDDISMWHMILGRNPDGTERVREYEDPNWTPPEEKEVDLTNITSWADFADEEDELIRPVIREKLPPLIKIIPPEGYKLEVLEQARPHSVSGELQSNVLKSSALLPFMNEKFIINQFKKFSTVKGYPKVYLKKEGPKTFAYVTFDQKNSDASFSLLMMWRREYKNDKNGKVFVVYYSYAPEKRFRK